jgi:hypothetical protein
LQTLTLPLRQSRRKGDSSPILLGRRKGRAFARRARGRERDEEEEERE